MKKWIYLVHLVVKLSQVNLFFFFFNYFCEAMKEACRQTFLSHSVRLMEPLYLCDIQIPSEYMGKVYPGNNNNL